jgi:hypothetical protein
MLLRLSTKVKYPILQEPQQIVLDLWREGGKDEG